MPVIVFKDRNSIKCIWIYTPPLTSLHRSYHLVGAFKADLFRYCVLLIRGGVYADMDVLLSADLDVVIPSDVGLMTGIDEVCYCKY